MTDRDDIVERMLDWAKLGNPGWHIPCIRLLEEGAAEIERLTAVNQRLIEDLRLAYTVMERCQPDTHDRQWYFEARNKVKLTILEVSDD